MAVCGRCAAHVGWSFRRESSIFYGLVKDAVVG
jgi:hypothetical protein